MAKLTSRTCTKLVTERSRSLAALRLAVNLVNLGFCCIRGQLHRATDEAIGDIQPIRIAPYVFQSPLYVRLPCPAVLLRDFIA